MNLVRAAMRRPVTVLVAVLTLILSSTLEIRKMPRDILPSLGIPVIYVAQTFGGMSPEQMEGFLTYYYEYHFLYITGIEHVESKTSQGVTLIKLQFQPGTDMAQAMSETISYVDRARAFMPYGTLPPFVMRFDTGSVPVGNLVFSSPTRSAGELQYYALNFVRPLLATLPGVSAPPPFGASQKSIVITVDPERLRAAHLSPDDVVGVIAQSNLISPSGNAQIGDTMPMVPTNTVVKDFKELEKVPLRPGATPVLLLGDVAKVESSTDIPTGYALVNGRRTVYIPVTKRADASTLAVVDLVKSNLAKFRSAVPEDVSVSYEFDQSPLVTDALGNLTTEGLLGALLTGLMVLVFLRDWRSALIVLLHVPLAVLGSTLLLGLLGHTVNLMTLGGMALAVGILVDDVTVTIENLHTHLGRGSAVARAALEGTQETAVPRLLSMLCVVAVFLPSFAMTGAPRAMFVPISLAVGFAMMSSYLLSNTLVPILATWILRAHAVHADAAPRRSLFDVLASAYARVAGLVVRLRWLAVPAYLAVACGALWWVFPHLGTEIFPASTAGQFQLRLRAPAGTRIDRTEKIALQTLDEIKQEVGEGGVSLSLGFVGVQPPNYPINTIYLWTGGPEEAVLQVQLGGEAKVDLSTLKERLRQRLAKALPDVSYSFEPSDLVSRVMSLGSPTPIEVAVNGPNMPNNRAFAQKVRAALAQIPSLRDLQYGQSLDYPTLEISVDRQRAGVMGVTPADVRKAVIPSTSSSRYVSPLYWADPATGIGFQVQVEVAPERMNSIEELRNVPIIRKSGDSVLLRNVASVKDGVAPGEVDRYDMQRMVTLTGNISGEDLGRVAKRIDEAVKQAGTPPPNVSVKARGQVSAMEQLFGSLEGGLVMAIVAIFLLIAAYFQSWVLAFVVLSSAPAVLAGAGFALLGTGSTLNLESFMGTIMAIGVAVANAILLVTFADRAHQAGQVGTAAAVEGARSRLRAILMTSGAMLAGMLPMALGTGHGGGQTAPLARAVMGGLAAGTLTTLGVLPAVFALLRGKRPPRSVSLDPDELPAKV